MQSDLSLRWQHMSEGTFSHVTTQMFSPLIARVRKEDILIFIFTFQFIHPSFVSVLPKRKFVLRFYGPVNPMGSCRARSVYLTTGLLGRLSPLSG